jgi:hypothetical protein
MRPRLCLDSISSKIFHFARQLKDCVPQVAGHYYFPPKTAGVAQWQSTSLPNLLAIAPTFSHLTSRAF